MVHRAYTHYTNIEKRQKLKNRTRSIITCIEHQFDLNAWTNRY